MAAKKNETEEPTEKKKGGKLKLIIILVLLLALLGGGGFVAWKFFLQPEGDPAAEGNATGDAAAKAKEEVPLEVVNLEPFVVNLADPMGRRYLKITMDVEVEPGVTPELNAAMVKVKDSLLLLLSSKTFSEISSMDQKIELKNEIMERLSQVVGKGKIKNIYFTEFVIQ